ncbi:unnamed protein product [Haemonchus placei]|uniref:Secreted protein n=1 Tax=Haemonchus placei TaxID=6290 RepID=A0A0N4VWD8_HAEPC|nr:unnamed protein product [Haemonchus placei]
MCPLDFLSGGILHSKVRVIFVVIKSCHSSAASVFVRYPIRISNSRRAPSTYLKLSLYSTSTWRSPRRNWNQGEYSS